jgi:ferric hydroxamate transport system substrate-binding protein
MNRRQFLTIALSTAAATACRSQSQSTPQSTTIPTRIVALEWVHIENLLSLGLQPIGVADIAGYQKFVNIEPKLATNVADVGTRQEPNLEAIAQLEPDLILGVKLRHEANDEALAAIAPTVLSNPYPESQSPTQFEEMQQTFLALADRVDRRTTAETVLKEMETTFKAAAEQLKAANRTRNPILLGQFNDTSPQIRIFTNNAMAMQILNKIGLQNAWQGQFEQFGFNTIGIEALTKFEQATFLYIAQEDNVHLKRLQTNPVWQGLQFVQEKRLYAIGAETWVFGGAKSAQVLAQKVTAALTS